MHEKHCTKTRPDLSTPPGSSPDLRADRDVRVRRVLRGGHDAVVSIGNRRAQVRSTLPLSFSAGRGEPRRALSTRLVRHGGALAPAHALSRYVIARRARAGDALVDFDRAGFSIGAPQTRNTRAREVSGKAIFANAAKDTDLLVSPLPTGASVMWQLRSADSPGSLRLAIGGADDVRVNGARPAELVRDGKRVGSISAPKAFDADGRPVGVRWVADGGGVRIDVDHRRRSVRHPVMVDPFVSDDQRWWIANGALDFRGWTYLGPASIAAAPGTSGFGRGLYLVAPAGSQHSGSTSGQWSFKARSVPGAFVGEGAHIFKVDFGYTAAAVQGSANACWAQGIFDNANLRWEPQGRWRGPNVANPYTSYPVLGDVRYPFVSCSNDSAYGYRVHCLSTCGLDGGDSTLGSAGNSAAIALVPKVGWTSGAVVYMGSSLIFQSESYAPKIVPRSPPSGWINAATLTVDATDYGLGTTALNASASGWAGAALPTPPCLAGDPSNHDTPGEPKQGDRNNRCRQTESLSFATPGMPEGSYSVGLTARDILGNTATSPMPVKIDHSGPVIDQIAGPLMESEDSRTGEPQLSLSVQAHDGESDSSRAGVQKAELLVDGVVKATQPVACNAAQCPRAVELSLTLDTTQLPEGDRAVAVRVTDGAGNVTVSDEWFINLVRADEMEAWLQRLRAYVDGLSIFPVIGEPPPPPEDYKDPDHCSTSSGALRTCYRALVSWQRAIDLWLTLNLVGGANAAKLPPMPVYEDAAMPDTTDLMRGAAALFQLTADVHADSAATRLATVSLETPVGPAQAESVLADAGTSGDVGLYGTFIASDRIYAGGGSGEKDEDDVLLPATIAEQVSNFYTKRVEITADLVADLESDDQEAPGDPETQAALASARSYQDAVNRRDPYISGFTAPMSERKLLDAIRMNATVIKSITIPQPAEDDANAVGPSLTLDAAIRNHADEQSAPAPRAAIAERAARPGSTFMPSRWRARTYLIGPRNRYGKHPKRTRIRLEWKRSGSLDYYRGAKNHKRGFEAQARPIKEGTPWSSGWWLKDSWDSDLPGAYRDDLFTDGTYKNFAVGTGYGRSIKANKRYSIYYDTNPGRYDGPDGGTVILEGQATRRARHSSARERGYCALKRVDSACFFAESTAHVGQYDVGDPSKRFSYP